MQEATQNTKPLLVIGVGVLALAIAGYQIFTGSRGGSFSLQDDLARKQRESQARASAAIQEQENIDSDGDSLTDNQETSTYRTNPFAADTDHDGHNDNEEIANGYDPLQADPTSATVQNNVGAYSYHTNLGTTAEELKSLPSLNDAEKTAQNLSGDTSDIDAVANLLTANATLKDDGTLPVVADTEITVTSQTGKAAAERYLTSVATLVVTLAPFASTQEMQSYVQAAITGDQGKLNETFARSKQLEKALLTLPVPTELVPIHKQTIGAVRLFLSNGEFFSNPTGLSPERGFQSISQITGLLDTTNQLVNDAFNVANKYNINITPFQ